MFESISTLKFAQRAKLIISKVKQNNVSAKNDAMVTKLKSEIRQLKDVLNLRKGKRGENNLEAQLVSLKLENAQLKDNIKNNQEVKRLRHENYLIRNQLKLVSRSPESYYGNSKAKNIDFSTEISKANSQLNQSENRVLRHESMSHSDLFSSVSALRL